MVSLINISTIAHFALYKKHVLHHSIVFNAMQVIHFFVGQNP